MKTTYLARHSAPVLAGLLVLALAACEDKKSPEEVITHPPTPLKVETIIFEPKVAAPTDTLLFTAVVTSTSSNVGDYPQLTWTTSAGEFVENDEMSVRWVAPASSGVATITAKAKNQANTATRQVDVFVGTGQTLITRDAGQIDLMGTGPDFYYLSTPDVSRGADAFKFVGIDSSDAVDNVGVPFRNLNIAYSPDGLLEAHQMDSLVAGPIVRPRNIFVGDFATRAIQALTKDRQDDYGSHSNRSQYSFPSFSPNSQVVAYQAWLHSYTSGEPDSFHVFIYDLVLHKRTLVTYEHEFPRGVFPTFSTDGSWLTYVADRSHSGAWDLYGSPMTGNVVDGSLASLKRMTNTGGILVVGAPRDLKRPIMAWNPVTPTLAVVASDGTLYLVSTNAAGASTIDVPGADKAQEMVWSRSGSTLAVTTGLKIATVSNSGVVTDRVTAISGDLLRDLAFSPDEDWMLYRVTRGNGSWFEILDLGAGVLTAPIPVTPTAVPGKLVVYRNSMSMRPAWTNANQIIFPQFGVDPFTDTPGIVSRDLSGLVD